MAENIVELLTDVADAIREKKGSNEPINAQNFANEIKNLPSGGGSGDIVITANNGVYGGTTDANTRYEAYIGGKITELGAAAFGGDKRIIKLSMSDNITKIGVNTFLNCSNLADVRLSNIIATVDSNSFGGPAITEIILPNAVTGIGSGAFNSCNTLRRAIIRPLSPPRLWGASFENNAADRLIYVPDESVDAYKSATNWAAYADAIRPMSELPQE